MDVPSDDIFNSLAKILMITDGDVNGCDLTFVHLPENVLRPVAVLKAINNERLFRHGPSGSQNI